MLGVGGCNYDASTILPSLLSYLPPVYEVEGRLRQLAGDGGRGPGGGGGAKKDDSKKA